MTRKGFLLLTLDFSTSSHYFILITKIDHPLLYWHYSLLLFVMMHFPHNKAVSLHTLLSGLFPKVITQLTLMV